MSQSWALSCHCLTKAFWLQTPGNGINTFSIQKQTSACSKRQHEHSFTHHRYNNGISTIYGMKHSEKKGYQNCIPGVLLLQPVPQFQRVFSTLSLVPGWTFKSYNSIFGIMFWYPFSLIEYLISCFYLCDCITHDWNTVFATGCTQFVLKNEE